MSTYEHRVCRSLESDSTRNTLELDPGLTFGILELLDPSDSQFFARYLLKKRWRNITPETHQQRKTYHSVKPSDEELREFESIVPDWFYISGHYARAAGSVQRASGVDYEVMYPTGFFNEPFHMSEFASEFNLHSEQSLFLQTESFTEQGRAAFEKYWQTHWLRSPYGPGAHTKTARDDTDRDKVIQQWFDLWSKPQDDVVLGDVAHGGHVEPGIRGLLMTPHWNDVKLVLLVGCNTLLWPKGVFHTVFPNALKLGYVNKNPANATPHIKAFLHNVFEGIVDRRDPKLLDHAHLSKAWMDVHTRQKPAKSNRMAYMDTSGKVFGWKQAKEIGELGSADSILSYEMVDPVR